MTRRSPIVPAALAALALLAGPAALGQEDTKTKAKSKPETPSAVKYVPVPDVPGLPRVLLIGDSISIGYTMHVRDALAGQANIHRPQANCGPTTRGVQNLDAWLEDGKWDVIHFNFGIHDLTDIRKDGTHQVPIAEYEKNLRTIVARLKRTGATLIWCSTTPMPEGSPAPRTEAELLAYNASARKIMDENGIRIDDLYAFALPRLKEIQRPANVHFLEPGGSKALAQQVAASIREVLPPPSGRSEGK